LEVEMVRSRGARCAGSLVASVLIVAAARATGQESRSGQPAGAGRVEGAPGVRRRLAQCSPPVIVTQPADAAIERGGSVTLTVVATGHAPLAYQWFRGVAEDTTTPIGTNAASLTTPPLDATTSYWVRVANACGQASSQAAVVTVSAPSAEEITFYLGPGNTVPLVMVRIRVGAPFAMGAPAGERGSNDYERPQHEVAIARDYYLGRYEVTQAQWQAVMGSNPSRFFGVGADYPVYDISWLDIAGPHGFLVRLNQALGTNRFRLPTEAEWEHAARAGTTAEFPFPVPADWGTGCESLPAAEPFMWWCGNAGNTTHPVGGRLPNQWGLFDMHGNVWEWVEDFWHDSYEGAPPADGSAWLEPAGWPRVLRGGSWKSEARACRSAQRYSYYPDSWGHGINGFRLAMTP
jgi:formylglycine-generating enzyme required for sulfatase activity